MSALGFPGFEVHSEAIDVSADVADLRGTLEWSQPSIWMFGKHRQVPRLTAWMGDAQYTYSGVRNAPQAMPGWVADVASQVAAIAGRTFNSVLANLYRDNRDSVSWHADDEPELGAEPVIASVSIGAAREFAIKPRSGGRARKVWLHHGDLVTMSGRSQADYLHAVPKSTRYVGPRINLTFRNIDQ